MAVQHDVHDINRDISWHFADFAAGAELAHIDEASVDAARKSVLDMIGVCLAASGLEPASRAALELARESGGAPQATTIGFGDRLPAPSTAFVNGTLAHALDYDDLTPWGQHAGSSVIPAALAIAERRGGVPGRDFVAAVAVGQDIFARLRRHVEWDKDWNLGSVLGVYAATATGCRLLELPAERIQSALGIATQQSSGVMEVVAGLGGDFRGMYAGFSAKGAVIATLLAERGVACVEAPFEGRYGVFNSYFDGHYERDGILSGLGDDHQGATTLYKRWPCVGTAHSHVHAARQIVQANGLLPPDILEIRVLVGDYHQLMCEPLAVRRTPRTLVDARFSLPFLVATVAVHGDVSLATFTPAGLADPEVAAMAQRVIPIPDAAYDWKLDLPAGRVDIITNDGRHFSQVGTHVPGSPDAPMTWGELIDKFTECASAAVAPASRSQIDTVVAMARRLETLDDVTRILAELPHPGA